MKAEFGRYPGDIRNFELWDWFTPQRVNGHYFTAVAEWLPDEGGWLSVCEKCLNFRCLEINIQKQTWQCQKCDRKGTFKKPEEKSEKKTDKPARKRVERNE